MTKTPPSSSFFPFSCCCSLQVIWIDEASNWQASSLLVSYFYYTTNLLIFTNFHWSDKLRSGGGGSGNLVGPRNVPPVLMQTTQPVSFLSFVRSLFCLSNRFHHHHHLVCLFYTFFFGFLKEIKNSMSDRQTTMAETDVYLLAPVVAWQQEEKREGW